MKKLIVTCILLFCTSFANAGNFDMLVHGVSWHSSGNFNERNEGVGIVYNQSKELSYAVGVYDNSLSKTSVYALVQYLPIEYKAVQAGIFAGGITGYPLTKIAAGGLVRINRGTVYHQFQLVPSIKGVTPAVVGYSFGFHF